MSNKRGALIVFEGCDQAEMSMRAKKLTKKLHARGIHVAYKSYPNENTRDWGVILKKSIRKKEIDVSPEVNESVKKEFFFFIDLDHSKEAIEKLLLSGLTVVTNRYAASGAAYLAANSSESLNSCQKFGVGLPKPDCVMFLKPKGTEHDEFQQRMIANYEKLMDDTWVTFETDQDKSKSVQNEILKKAELVIKGIGRREIERIKSD